MITIEVCLDDLAGVRRAEAAGADRVELCSALDTGGVTPSIGTVDRALGLCSRIGLQVLIRQRPGDFVFDDDEVAAMIADVQAARVLDRAVPLGFVIGALRGDATVDVEATRALVQACGEAPVTFHKAFDQTPDRAAALEQLIGLGVRRVLTSGGAPTAADGADELAALVRQAGDRIVVLAGGGIRPANVADLLRRTGVREVHLRAVEEVSSASHVRSAYDDGRREVTSSRIVAAVVDAVRRAEV